MIQYLFTIFMKDQASSHEYRMLEKLDALNLLSSITQMMIIFRINLIITFIFLKFEHFKFFIKLKNK